MEEIQEPTVLNNLVDPFDQENVNSIYLDLQLDERKIEKSFRTKCKIQQIYDSINAKSGDTTKENVKMNILNTYQKYELTKDMQLLDGPESSSFFNMFMYAFLSHGQVTLCPDDIWQQITLAFSQIVSEQSEKFRDIFVSFEGKKVLEVHLIGSKHGIPTEQNFNWEYMFNEFRDQMKNFTHPKVLDILTADFTTTTPISQTISQICVMDILQHYFEYKLRWKGCGFKAIHMKGQLEDWEQLCVQLEELEELGKGQGILIEFIDGLRPILKQFVQTFKDQPDHQFWNSIFSTENSHRFQASSCAMPTTVLTGWITQFFPERQQFFSPRIHLIPFVVDGADATPDKFKMCPEYYVDIPLDITLEEQFKFSAKIISCFGGVICKDNNYTLQTKFGVLTEKIGEFKSICLNAQD